MCVEQVQHPAKVVVVTDGAAQHGPRGFGDRAEFGQAGLDQRPDRAGDLDFIQLRHGPLVVATGIVVAALAAVSEIVLPLTFAAVLAVIFKPSPGCWSGTG